LSCRLPHSRTAGVSVWESITEVESSFAYRDYLVGESTSEATIRENQVGVVFEPFPLRNGRATARDPGQQDGALEFPPKGVLRLDNSTGEITIQGWDLGELGCSFQAG
jgi:hypothetical protein